MSTLGARIRIIRKQEKLSQDAFGIKIGCSRETISKMETDSITINDARIGLICETFGVSRRWLERGEGKMRTAESVDDQQMEKNVRIFQSLPPSYRKVILATMEAMLEVQRENEQDGPEE